ncbi:MAG TPA: tyrosine-type recombinase/integrase [Candidatus Competibacteraceae bacterium]|nr:tyrosine-type recombinase/integrase [Candidatus Competibacteraceae bacterium]
MGRKRSTKNRDLPLYLYRYADGLYLYERPDGRRFSLGNNKARAVRLAVQLNQEFRAPSAIEEQLLRKITGKESNRFVDVIARYMSEYLPDRGLAQKTLVENRRMLTAMIPVFGEIATDNLTVKQVADYLDTLPANTSNKYRAQLGQFYAWAIAKGVAEHNPAEATLKKREIISRQRMTLEQYRVIHAAAAPWFQNAMDLGLQTLQRREDLCWIRFDDIRDGRLFISQRKVSRHNSGHLAILILPPLHEVINRCRSGVLSPFLIHRDHEKRRPSNKREHWSQVLPEMLSREFQDIRDRLGLFGELSAEQRPSFHEIRALGAHLYRQHNIDPQTLLGHTSQKTTRVYLDRHQIEHLEVDAGIVLSAYS